MLLQVASAGQGLERHLSTSVAGDVDLMPAVLLDGRMVVGLVEVNAVVLTAVLLVGCTTGGLVAGMISLVTLLAIVVVGPTDFVLSPVV